MAEEKKSLWEKAKELFATYGNPGGGFVHKDVPDETKEDAAPAPVEKDKEAVKAAILKHREEYRAQLVAMYAAHGNPGGGLVHNDMPAAKNAAVAKKLADRAR